MSPLESSSDDARRLVGSFGGGRRTNLKADAATHLRDAILTGELRPGARIDQEAIAAELGISRLPVREAIIELAQEGLVDSIPRRGAYVAAIERDDVIEHYRIYGVVSGVAAERATTRFTPDELAHLRALHEQLGSCTEPSEQELLNFDFHRVVNRVGGNRRLLSLLRLLSRSLPMHYFEFAPRWAETAALHHGEILAAFEARDAAGARVAMEHHLGDSGSRAVEILESVGFWADS